MAVLVSSCGARSGLDAERLDAAGGPPRTPPFATLPCRWTLGREGVVRAGVPRRGIGAAVSGAHDEVLVSVDDEVGYVLSLTDPPQVLREIAGVSRELWSAPGGWSSTLRPESATCAVREVAGPDDAPGPAGGIPLDGVEACRTTARTLDELHVLGRTAAGARLLRVSLAGELRLLDALELALPGELRGGAASWQPGAGWTAATDDDASGITLHHAGTDGRIHSAASGSTGPVAVAPDRLRGGLALLRRPSPVTGWMLERLPAEGEPRIELVSSLRAIGTGARLELVTNETEALVPLDDGRIAVAPLNGIDPHTIGPVAPGATVGEVVVSLRTGTSVGGVAYVVLDEGLGRDTSRVGFRTLTCNR